MNVPILGQPQPEKTSFGPDIRILICFDCKTIDEIPDFAGPPEYDHLLQLVIDRKHTDPVTKLTHRGDLGKVPVMAWADRDTRRRIIKQYFQGSGGMSEFDEKFYDTRSQFFEDAVACFERHLRPAGRCPDWKADSKKLVPDTRAERKDLGLAPARDSASVTYLCDFCPAKTYMATQARKEAGLYN